MCVRSENVILSSMRTLRKLPEKYEFRISNAHSNLRESVSRLIIRVIISLPRRGSVAYDCVTKNALWRTLSFHFFFRSLVLFFHYNAQELHFIACNYDARHAVFYARFCSLLHIHSLCPFSSVNYPRSIFCLLFFFHNVKKVRKKRKQKAR